MDVLSDMLQRSRARGAAFSYSSLHGAWGLRFPSGAGLAVHALVEGEAHLWTDDDADPVRLAPGDIVLVRGSLAHCMAHAPGAACIPLHEHLASAAVQGSTRRFVSGTAEDGPPAVFFCGAYLFAGDLCDGLLQALPRTLAMRPASGGGLRATMDLLAREMLDDEVGQQTMLDRLLDMALVQILRDHFASRPAQAPAWFQAQGDAAVGAALRALHADPGLAWTVAGLAAEALLSRAAFARRFTALLGVSPLAYLTDLRMALARERLRESDDDLAAIAAQLGYASPFSFAAAFKRHHGVAPGRWRNEHTAPEIASRPERAATHTP